MGKARLAPVKTMTVARLEVTAASISVQVGKMIRIELGEPVDSETFWTDSTALLKYIRNETKRVLTSGVTTTAELIRLMMRHVV